MGSIAVACGGETEPSDPDENPGGDGDGDGDADRHDPAPGDGDGDTGVASGGLPIISLTGGSSMGGSAPGTGGTMGGATTGGAASMGGSRPMEPCQARPTVHTNPLIDDLEHPGESTIPEIDGRSGSWFVANDGELGGVQTPDSLSPFPQATATPDGLRTFHSTASGFETWGALFGLTLEDTAGPLCGYDASHYTGIQFMARSGDGSSHSLEFAVPIPAIIPVSRGGTCSGEGCDDSHHAQVLVTATWETYQIPFASLSQAAGWTHDNKYEFDPTKVAQLVWQSRPGVYDVVVDDVRFYVDPD